MISKREQLDMGVPLFGLPSRQRPEEDTYRPKHMKNYRRDGMSHCCFAGCRPGPCGCCRSMPFHEADCDSHPSREMDEAMHDIYVNMGGPKHYAPKPPEPPTPPKRRQTRYCDCGDVARYGNRCGESGCQNRPA